MDDRVIQWELACIKADLFRRLEYPFRLPFPGVATIMMWVLG